MQAFRGAGHRMLVLVLKLSCAACAQSSKKCQSYSPYIPGWKA